MLKHNSHISLHLEAIGDIKVKLRCQVRVAILLFVHITPLKNLLSVLYYKVRATVRPHTRKRRNRFHFNLCNHKRGILNRISNVVLDNTLEVVDVSNLTRHCYPLSIFHPHHTVILQTFSCAIKIFHIVQQTAYQRPCPPLPGKAVNGDDIRGVFIEESSGVFAEGENDIQRGGLMVLKREFRLLEEKIRGVLFLLTEVVYLIVLGMSGIEKFLHVFHAVPEEALD